MARDRHADVLHFSPSGRLALRDQLRSEPVALPEGVVRVASGPVADGLLPGETTVWLTEWPA